MSEHTTAIHNVMSNTVCSVGAKPWRLSQAAATGVVRCGAVGAHGEEDRVFRTVAAMALQGEPSRVLTETPWACWVFDFELILVHCVFKNLLLLPNFVWRQCLQTQLTSCVIDQ